MNDDWKYIKDLSSELGSDLDVDAAWDEFHEKRKRRVIPFWLRFSVGSLLVFIIVFGTYYFTISDSPTSETLSHLPPKSEVDEAIPATTIKESTVSSKKMGYKKDTPSSTTKLTFDTNKEYTKKKLAVNNGKDPFTISVSTLDSSVKNAISLSPSLDKPINHSDPKSENTINENSQNNIGLTIAEESVERSNDTDVIKDQDNPTINIQVLSLLPSMDLIHLSSEVIAKEMTLEYDQLSGDNFSALTVGIFSGYSQFNNTFKYADVGLGERRNTHETPLEQIRFGLSIEKLFNGKFFIESGLIFSQHRSKITDEYQTITTNIVFEDQLIAHLLKEDQTEEVWGSVLGSHSQKFRNIRYQNYRSIGIPLFAGYKVSKDVYALSFALGLQYNIWTQASGNTYSSGTSIGEYNALSVHNYRSRGQLEGLSKVGLSRTLGSRKSTGIEFIYRSDITNRLINELDTHRMNSLGINVFFRKTL